MNSEPVAVNVSRESLLDLEFHAWLEQYLKTFPNPDKIHFDIPESGITSNLDIASQLCDIIKKAGSQFGVDNCGRQLGSLDYLQNIKHVNS